jgi:hypothetical protein
MVGVNGCFALSWAFALLVLKCVVLIFIVKVAAGKRNKSAQTLTGFALF